MPKIPIETVQQRPDANLVAVEEEVDSETDSEPTISIVLYPIEMIDNINKMQQVINENLSRLEEILNVCLRPVPETTEEQKVDGEAKDDESVKRPVLSRKLQILVDQAGILNGLVEQLIERVEL